MNLIENITLSIYCVTSNKHDKFSTLPTITKPQGFLTIYYTQFTPLQFFHDDS